MTRNVEWALFTLSRGGAVRVGGFAFTGSEGGISENRVLAAPRAAYLGLGEGDRRVGLESRPATRDESLALRLLKRAGLLPEAVPVEAAEVALSTEEAEAYLQKQSALHALPPVSLPLAGAEDVQAVGFAEEGAGTHLLLRFGVPGDVPLVRLHSSCLTGDVLHSLRCDCGEQLAGAVAALKNGGVLLYLNQEGRGIGLSAKLRAYQLQETGLDTVDANRALGYGDDERDFSLAARMLKHAGITRVRLLTNNPAKMAQLQAHGIEVAERVPLKVQAGAHNAGYLKAKETRFGHF